MNGNVGATQYLQWNNTAFAIFDKTTGALQYGPAAGNTLFQELGGICAQFNDGDPVVSYDILAGRWVLSQFVAGASQTSFSHQCFAVSATSDATGEYYLYDFETDPVNLSITRTRRSGLTGITWPRTFSVRAWRSPMDASTSLSARK